MLKGQRNKTEIVHENNVYKIQVQYARAHLKSQTCDRRSYFLRNFIFMFIIVGICLSRNVYRNIIMYFHFWYRFDIIKYNPRALQIIVNIHN